MAWNCLLVDALRNQKLVGCDLKSNIENTYSVDLILKNDMKLTVIGDSPNYGSMSAGYRLTARWLEKELEKASQDSARKPLNTAPAITDTNGTAEFDEKDIILSFNAGTDDDFVHSYKVVIDGEETKLFFSDFYKGLDNMSQEVALRLKARKGEYTYEIYAIDSWGAESTDCVVIKTQ